MKVRHLLFGAAASLLTSLAQADLSVSVHGLSDAELQNVQHQLAILRYAESDGADEAQIRRLHRQAESDIRAALQVFGYYSPQIQAQLTGAHPDLAARYEVEPGPPTLLGSVRIELLGEGQDFPDLRDEVARTALREGVRLQHTDYERTKAALSRIAYQNGFLDAVYVSHRLQVNVAQRRADVLLQLDTGPRFFFGEVTVEQDGLDDEFLARYVPIRPGAPFEPQKLLDTQFALGDLGYFSSVDVQVQRDAEVDRKIPILIVATLRPRQRYDIGVGYGTDTGARLTTSAEFRRLTRTGHTLRTDLRLSEIKNRIGADYRIPLGTRTGETLGFAAAYTDEEIGDGESRRYDYGVSLSRSPSDWRRRIYLNYLIEQSTLPDVGTTRTKLLIPGVSLSRGESDDPIHARLGWYGFADIRGAWDEVVSDATYLQGRLLLRGALPLFERGRLLGRWELGGSLVEEFSELPPSQRFFAGGDQSVRGYAYQSLGPRDANGNVVGGKFLNAYSIEAEVRIWDFWGAAVFLDAGNAGDSPWIDLNFGIGAGIRYRAPIGTLQLDLAHPLERPERGIRPHLGIRVGL